MKSKSEIRKDFLIARNALRDSEREEKDGRLIQNLTGLEFFRNSKNPLLYWSVNGEAGTRDLIRQCLEDPSKTVWLPRITDAGIFEPARLEDISKMSPGLEGIPEPVGESGGTAGSETTSRTGRIDLVIVPGVAFGRDGSRIGMGKGYYDRFLSTCKSVIKIGLAYEEQVLDWLPKETYDICVDWLVTDQKVYEIKPNDL